MAKVPQENTANQRMSRPNDARALRSREALRAALLNLVGSTPFEQISIRDITNSAGVSYPVFFRRYKTKEQLLEDVATEEVRNLLNYARPMTDMGFSALCTYVEEHRLLWTTLLTTGVTSAMRSEFMRIALEIGSTRPRNASWLPMELAANYVVSGIFEILSWWLRQPADYPVENVVKILEVLIVRATAPQEDIVLI